MNGKSVRPLALCVFRKNDSILVGEGHDRVKKETFYRPLGGAIEVGEYARETVVREIREEIGCEIRNVHYLGTIENIFIYEGRPGHEIDLIFEGELADRALYDRQVVEGKEENGKVRALWKPIDSFRTGHVRLYPDGLLDLLTK